MIRAQTLTVRRRRRSDKKKKKVGETNFQSLSFSLCVSLSLRFSLSGSFLSLWELSRRFPLFAIITISIVRVSVITRRNKALLYISLLCCNKRKISSERVCALEENLPFSTPPLPPRTTEFEEKEAAKSTSKDTLNADYNFMEIVENILGEDGVKNLAVKTILPGLNTNIAAMTQTMHLQFHIRFDEKFNCIINHLGEDINPMTLSTGERKKADFIVIIAIIKILKLRFPQLNLLFLDELLSSVDHDGVYNILKILNQVIKEHEINTFVINHSVLPHEIFDKKIEIYRENGFSKFTIENID